MYRLKAILTNKITMGHMGAATEQEMLAFDCSYINCRFIGKSRFKPCLGSTACFLFCSKECTMEDLHGVG